jgi:hypothetical protein
MLSSPLRTTPLAWLGSPERRGGSKPLPSASTPLPVREGTGKTDVNGSTVAALFFLGGMVMKMMKKLRRRSLDQVCATFFPLPGTPKMSAYDTYGIAGIPFSVRQRGEVCTKSRTNDRREGDFTQVRAANQRKTLLLPCFIKSVLEPKLQERLQ